jgi:biopolymer transport protein ExbB/TolQ
MLDTLLTLILRSSVLMTPILLGAVASVSIAVWQLARLRRADANGAALYAAVSGCIEDGDLPAALAMCQRRRGSAVGQVLAEILTEHGEGVENLHRVADYATMAQRGRLSTHAGHLLPTIANVVVLCGLLGSIHGLMMGFGSFGGMLPAGLWSVFPR